MKKLIIFAAAALLGVLSLSACTNAKKETTKGTESMENKKVLVAYFSWSGNTREAAKYIAQKLKADEAR